MIIHAKYPLAAIAACLSLLIPLPAAAAPVAMVTDMSGSVTLSEAGKARAASLLAYIEPGTDVRIDSGGRLVLTYFSKPIEVTLTGPADATIGAEGVKVAKGNAAGVRSLDARRVDTARKFEPVQREKLALATVQMRGAARPQIIVDGPANTSVYVTSPVLSWGALPGVSSYRVVVSDSSGKTHLDQAVQGTRLILNKPPLKYGASYDWRVEANLGSGELISAKANFSVIDGARARRIASAKPRAGASFSERVLFAAQLESEGLAYDAKQEWRTLAAERPGDASLREWAER
jgi:hypothetical protein